MISRRDLQDAIDQRHHKASTRRGSRSQRRINSETDTSRAKSLLDTSIRSKPQQFRRCGQAASEVTVEVLYQGSQCIPTLEGVRRRGHETANHDDRGICLCGDASGL